MQDQFIYFVLVFVDMKKRTISILVIFLFVCILTSGCTIKKDLGSLSDNGSIIQPSPGQNVVEKRATEIPITTETGIEPNRGLEESGPVQLKGMMESTFPRLTNAYMEIRTADIALDAVKTQEKALALETLVKELTMQYHLDRSLPEKNIFPDLNTKEKFIINNYIGFIKDLGLYASNLKQAIYWKNSGDDTVSRANYRRYQDLSDQYEKKVVTDVKTLEGYCNEWNYPYLDTIYVTEYSFIPG